jgi:hypothetical protein
MIADLHDVDERNAISGSQTGGQGCGTISQETLFDQSENRAPIDSENVARLRNAYLGNGRRLLALGHGYTKDEAGPARGWLC